MTRDAPQAAAPRMPDDTPRRRGPGRPSQGGPTKGRHIRVGQVWDDLERHYTARGENMTTVVKRLLDQEAARLREAGELT